MLPLVWNRSTNRGKCLAVKSIQLGQVWRNDEDGQDYLVTKVYNEVFTQFAVLRPAEVTAPDAPTVASKSPRAAEGARFPDSPLLRKVRFSVLGFLAFSVLATISCHD